VYPHHKSVGISLLHCLWNKEEIITEVETVAGSLNKTGNVRINPNIKAHSSNHPYCEKAISITYAECAYVALVIQCARRMIRIMLSSVAYLALPYLSNRTILGEKS
jgi:hypothetical protein